MYSIRTGRIDHPDLQKDFSQITQDILDYIILNESYQKSELISKLQIFISAAEQINSPSLKNNISAEYELKIMKFALFQFKIDTADMISENFLINSMGKQGTLKIFLVDTLSSIHSFLTNPKIIHPMHRDDNEKYFLIRMKKLLSQAFFAKYSKARWEIKRTTETSWAILKNVGFREDQFYWFKKKLDNFFDIAFAPDEELDNYFSLIVKDIRGKSIERSRKIHVTTQKTVLASGVNNKKVIVIIKKTKST